MIKCIDIIREMEKLAPVGLAEDWDNVDLLVGDKDSEVKKILLALDVTSQVIDEAVDKKVNLIIARHPMIFKPIKKITQDDLLGSKIIKLIKNNISLYIAHTNVDVVKGGISDLLSQMLGLIDIKIMDVTKKQAFKKMVVFVPEGYEDQVREAMSKEGAGWIGNYSECTYMTKGTGTFKPLQGTNPFIGQTGQLEKVQEYRLETIIPVEKVNNVIKAMIAAHPYEEVAYDIYPIDLGKEIGGIGRIGFFDAPVSLRGIIKKVKSTLNIQSVKYTGNQNAMISKVAVCTGSGAEFIPNCIKNKVDLYITSDIKYHDAQLAFENGLNIIDAGHYETEIIIVPHTANYLRSAFQDKIDIMISENDKGFLYFA